MHHMHKDDFMKHNIYYPERRCSNNQPEHNLPDEYSYNNGNGVPAMMNLEI